MAIFIILGAIFIVYKKIMGADKPMKVIIDRFEGNYAVVELPDKTTVDMPTKLLESGAKEGDVIEIKTLQVVTQERKFKINKLMDDVFEKNR